GLGMLAEKEKRVVDFKPLEHWTGNAWQPAAKYPDVHFGHLSINAKGGHPSNRPQDAGVLRWTAPAGMTVKSDGRLNHPTDKGDGVRARVFASDGRQLGNWTATHRKMTTKVERVELKAGEWLDFVVDCRESPNYDAYEWTPTIEQLGIEAPQKWSGEA